MPGAGLWHGPCRNLPGTGSPNRIPYRCLLPRRRNPAGSKTCQRQKSIKAPGLHLGNQTSTQRADCAGWPSINCHHPWDVCHADSASNSIVGGGTGIIQWCLSAICCCLEGSKTLPCMLPCPLKESGFSNCSPLSLSNTLSSMQHCNASVPIDSLHHRMLVMHVPMVRVFMTPSIALAPAA